METVRRQFFGADLLDPHVFCETGSFQQSALDSPTDSVGAVCGVDGAERLRTLAVARGLWGFILPGRGAEHVDGSRRP